MLHLENDALSRREQLHGDGQPRLDFLAEKPPLGIERRPVFALAFKKVGDALVVIRDVRFWRLIFRAGLAAAQLIEANVGNDAV
jgi:hypothetical protein